MRNLMRMVPLFVLTGAVGFVAGVVGTPSVEAAAGHEVNACGCYRDSSGGCLCGKRGRCDCPGDCEPRGCEEKRARDMDKEIQEETQRAQAAERKQHDEYEAKRRKEEQAAAQEQAASSGNSQATDEPAEETSVEEEAAPAEKPAKKTKHKGRSKTKAKPQAH
jgi:hypothetical protein